MVHGFGASLSSAPLGAVGHLPGGHRDILEGKAPEFLSHSLL